MKKVLLSIFLVTITVAFSSCNLTRVVQTESQCYQLGDSSCTITTKTIESYDATKKN